jgi:hypothetical protein
VRICGMRSGLPFSVTPADFHRLRGLVKDRNASQNHAWRARSCRSLPKEPARTRSCARPASPRLASGAGRSVSPPKALRDKTRPSRIAKLDPSIAERVVAPTMEELPQEATHWTGAAMAKAIGVSVSSVQRTWRAHGLQPHRVGQLKLPKDPNSSTSCAISSGSMLTRRLTRSSCPSTKSQIQALDRTQPGQPLKKGRAETMTREYNGTARPRGWRR